MIKRTRRTGRIYGAGKALVITALIPVVMAFGYLMLILYFKKRGGYKQIEIDDSQEKNK